MNSAPRILVVRLSALGDVAMASGLIPVLRAVHPDARLAWLTEPAAAPLLRANPRLDELLIWDRPSWRRMWKERRYVDLWRAWREFRQQLRAGRYDLVIDAQGLLKSGLCAWWTGAPRRLGLHPREGSQWLMTERFEPHPMARPQIGSEYRQLAAHLGAPEHAFRLDVVPSDQARRAAQEALARSGVATPYAALCPFTTRPQKHWFPDRWAALAQRLRDEGITPVLLGGPADHAAALDILHQHGAPAADLVGQLRLDESAAVIQGASLLIGVDTGLTHIGTAMRVPTVALFGSTRPYLSAGEAPTRVMYEALPCSPCRRHPTCGGRFDCMRAHSVDAVAREARTIMETAR